MPSDHSETERLLRLAGIGDRSAIGRLLEKHQGRLKRMIADRLEPRLAARVDPSDIVQDTLVDACKELPRYARERPLPYYAWLRRLSLDRLAWWRRFLLKTSKRDLNREVSWVYGRSDTRPAGGVDHLVDKGTSPSGRAIRDEDRGAVRAALDRLPEIDRRVLELRYDQGKSFAEIATELGIGTGAAKMRHFRALERFNAIMAEADGESVR